MSEPALGQPAASFSLKAWLQLCRLPNVFTALADVLMGYWFTHQELAPPTIWLPLAAASGLIYTAGMVLNDVFDSRVDAEERPARPLPSGRVSLGAARAAGIGMLIAGFGLACVAGYFAGQWRPAAVAAGLAALVVAYDGWLKQTPLGPLAMGGCRMLNVLLGMSAAEGNWHPVHLVIAGGLGLYVVGFTWFARTEAEESSRPALVAATLVMGGGLALAASFPWWSTAGLDSVSWPQIDLTRWVLCWGLLAGMVGVRCMAAVRDPSPRRVQQAVKSCILSLVVLDAVVCVAVRGLGPALVIMALLIPALFLGRWICST